MRTISIGIAALLAAGSLYAQPGRSAVQLQELLTAVEANNTTLKALRASVDAQKSANRTGIYLPDPEAGLNYLWGHPADAGNRIDLSVTQRFDLPTITGMKRRLADGQDHLAEWQYRIDRIRILSEATQYGLELIYCNALMRELDTRLTHAEAIAGSYRERLDRGDASVLEYNRARLNLSSVQGERARVEAERRTLHEQLRRLNGGEALLLDDDRFTEIDFPPNFEDWYVQAEAKNPALAYVKQEIEVSKRQVTMSRAMGWPVFSAGYMSEKVVGQRYQGITVGISVPLWENRNRVRQAKAAVRAAESRASDSKRQFYGQLQSLYRRASGLKAAAEVYRRSLETDNSSVLLQKAFDAGEISLPDYLLETGFYYDAVDRWLEAERDYRKAYAELSAAEL